MSLLDELNNAGGSDESEEDDDYVPSGAEESEEASDAAVSEDEIGEFPDAKSKSKKTKKPKKTKKTARTRKGGIKLDDGDKVEEEAKEVEHSDVDEDEEEKKPVEEDTGKKKERIDNLWADFLKDVGQTPKSSAKTIPSQSAKEEKAEEETPKPKKVVPEPPKKITITEIFDFAGEAVSVTKQVAADSIEAKNVSTPQSSKSSATPFSGKRKSGIGGLLNQLTNKKQKMSTLTKSHLDWEGFKSEEGINEELKHHNQGKGGYLEKQKFLNQVDVKQFEIEKKMREKTRSTRLN